MKKVCPTWTTENGCTCEPACELNRKNGLAFKVFEEEVRKRLKPEQNEWWDSDAASGSWHAEWTVEETLIVIKEAWEDFCKIGETLEIITKVGRRFRVQIVNKGDKYGLDKCLTHNEDKPMVEFYDISSTKIFGDEGQFVSRYYIETLIKDRRSDMGLDLCGHEPAWKIDGATMDLVVNWIRQRQLLLAAVPER